MFAKEVCRVLKFKGMEERYDKIPEAHEKTFAWLLSNEEDSNAPLVLDDVRRAAKDKLLTWLSSGAGVLHLSGKIGAGKSTLMKYLASHDRTMSELQKWAGHRKTVLANFCFWKLGPESLQKSFQGLMRTILHNVVSSHPDLAPYLFRDLPQHPQQDLSTAESIRNAFTILVTDEYIARLHCFCFFIDGLDEHEGTLNFDHGELVEKILSWADRGSGETIELLVSSREENAFVHGLDAYPRSDRIRIHEVTRRDIEEYVHATLEGVVTARSTEVLYNRIACGAGGVFLWVTLVVHEIRGLAKDGFRDRLDFLLAKVHEFPSKLDVLFSALLASLDHGDRRRAYLTFAILAKYSEISLEAYSYLEDWILDSTFAVAALVDDGESIRQATASKPDRIADTTRRVNRYCRGLVEVDHQSRIVLLTHVSVADSLAKDDQAKLMAAALGPIPNRALYMHLVLAARWNRVDAPDLVIDLGFVQNAIFRRTRGFRGSDDDPHLVQFLDAWWQARGPRKREISVPPTLHLRQLICDGRNPQYFLYNHTDCHPVYFAVLYGGHWPYCKQALSRGDAGARALSDSPSLTWSSAQS